MKALPLATGNSCSGSLGSLEHLLRTADQIKCFWTAALLAKASINMCWQAWADLYWLNACTLRTLLCMRCSLCCKYAYTVHTRQKYPFKT